MKILHIPFIFYKNDINNKFLNDYKIIPTEKLINKYKIFKNFYFILFYSDFILLDNKIILDILNDNKKVLKYLDKNKKNLLFFYYNKKIYNFKSLVNLISFYSFSYLNFYSYLHLKQLNLNLFKLLIYIKKKKYAYNQTII